ncbi:GATOR complex protein NPRL3 [Contarinia nasturtii]|uniref:GATOR complex protein NPRL3 n=1 Tax=Contarinia nasturtii TaxID=265458 RepID=UPI0012D38038|nr:GATOR complex protein NPRL3 [Contarinia nasturtii]XP_031622102.1 GATOR complex protein NPRL3 [Contarinia nasturtii]
MEVNPLSIILVKSDSKGDRLLFRYPYCMESNEPCLQNKRRNPYSIPAQEDILQSPPPQTSNIHQGQLSGFTDEVLSTLFAVKAELCNQKFELKVNDVRFVAHPTLMQSKGVKEEPSGSSILINIVFALYAQASYSIVKCYYELSKRLGNALVYEENRVGYLTDEMKLILKTHDEVAENIEEGRSLQGITAFDQILERSSLALCLKTIYQDLCSTGLLNITINQFITLSFCLPQKAHQFHKKGVVVEPEAIDRCLKSLKPYHGMLLLVDYTELLDCVPPSGAVMLTKLLNAYNPFKTLQNIATDADFAIKHVYELVGHLVYWAKATIIYPLCETNVYVIAPDAPLHNHSPLAEKFYAKFSMNLFEVISEFSLPTSIGHLTTPLQYPTKQGTLVQMVLWMLQHHLLMQLHTYVQFMPTDHGECIKPIDAKPIASTNSVNNENATQINPPKLDDSMETLDETTELLNGNENGQAFGSLLSIESSQPMPVPKTAGCRSISEDRFSEMAADSNISDNMGAPSSSNKSNYSISQSDTMSTENCESLASVEDEDKIKELLMAFQEPERSAVRDLPAASNVEDLTLMVKLYQAGYFKGEHHLEEIMYFENLRRSQLLQLLDKFRDVLIIYETEDPAIATLYTQT